MRFLGPTRFVAAGCALLITASGCAGAGPAAAGPFIGYWHVHVYALTIRSDGDGMFQWPLDRYCPPPSPCPPRAGEDHGSAHLALVRRDGDRYLGQVTGSNQTAVVPDGPVVLVLGTQDLMQLQFQSHPSAPPFTHYLCGTKTKTQVVNCG